MGKKNFYKIPKNVKKELENIKSDFIKIGLKKKIMKESILNGDYQALSLHIEGNELKYKNSIIPLNTSGKYSRYNQEGRSIKRTDLPKVRKWYSHDVYPYGDTSKSMVTVTYSREVTQEEIWIPEFITINITIDEEVEDYYVVKFETDDILDKKDSNFEKDLLLRINLLQENIGSFEVYSADSAPMYSVTQAKWDFLPPGNIDITYIQKNFGNRTKEQQEEIMERFTFIESLNPLEIIKGTNKFNLYFGAKFSDEIVVLENVINGNAIYVFHQDWETLSQLSRTELFTGYSDKVKRIIHIGNWKEVLKKELTM